METINISTLLMMKIFEQGRVCRRAQLVEHEIYAVMLVILCINKLFIA